MRRMNFTWVLSACTWIGRGGYVFFYNCISGCSRQWYWCFHVHGRALLRYYISNHRLFYLVTVVRWDVWYQTLKEIQGREHGFKLTKQPLPAYSKNISGLFCWINIWSQMKMIYYRKKSAEEGWKKKDGTFHYREDAINIMFDMKCWKIPMGGK